ncbi:mitochondrial carrier domain-containing protein [Myxozyma melibiosi]|uniref:Mitochondrial carrier domain-containing protein n=1 Tax=Myxozyma melibiosi TaxID=54550 RepID=A0ABR1FCQ5_9ASCO
MSDSSEITDTVKEIASKAQPESSAFMGQVKSFASGGVGGICAVLVGHPFDLIKVRLQTAEKGVYSGAFDALKKTVARDGVMGVYRGVSPPLLGVTPMFAISFWGYDLGKRIVTAVSPPSPNGQLSIAQISAAGFFSAIPTTLVAAPFERIKVLLQLEGQSDVKKYSGPIDVVRKIYKEGGMRSLMRGSVATLARDGPGSAIYFAVYEYLKERLTPAGQSMSLAAISFAGGMSGVAMWVAVYPIDTIKSQLQSSSTHTNISKVTKAIYSGGGIKAFFPGIGPALMRSFPANAATFVGVEVATKFLDKFI